MTARARGSFRCARRNATDQAWPPRRAVHEGLDGKDVAMGAQGPERSVADRRIEKQVISDFLSRKLIGRRRVAVSISEWLRNAWSRRREERLLQVPKRQKVHTAGLAGSHGVAVAPHIVGPIDNPALRRGPPQGASPSRAYRRPGELVIAHPLQLDGPARHRARDRAASSATSSAPL